jgi:LmbE family N-acetylglucosaminyl deacetylase
MDTNHLLQPATPPRRPLGIWAHPDDEAYLSAGLMARTTDAGGHVTCVTATMGEHGFAADDPRSPTERARLRAG